MKRVMASISVLVAAVSMAYAAWTMPSEQDLLAAAQDPNKLAALLQGASDEEATKVLVAVLKLIESTQLPATEIATLVGGVVSKGLEGRTDAGRASIATALGRAASGGGPLAGIATPLGNAMQQTGGAPTQAAFGRGVGNAGGSGGGTVSGTLLPAPVKPETPAPKPATPPVASDY